MAKPKYRTREHRLTRKHLVPIVNAGQAWCAEAVCLMPTRWIEPGTPWDLAHAPGDNGYLGPAHALCNRSEGGKRAHQPRATPPTRWVL